MEGENKVKLHGTWASTYSKRVELALRVKGIPYEYIEEDLSNKSPSLLHYNPVYKKVPVLVHNGKPIAESYIILEYIDETWQNGPRLLPQDPYQRAQIRFWVSFIQQQVKIQKKCDCHIFSFFSFILCSFHNNPLLCQNFNKERSKSNCLVAGMIFPVIVSVKTKSIGSKRQKY